MHGPAINIVAAEHGAEHTHKADDMQNSFAEQYLDTTHVNDLGGCRQWPCALCEAASGSS